MTARRRAAVCCWGAVLLASAATAQAVTLSPAFRPDSLGSSTVVTLTIDFTSAGMLVPAPVRHIVLQLPAGLEVDLHGVRSCSLARLRARGASGCPAGSLLGAGRARMEVHAGSQTIPEQTVLSAFRSPDRGGRPAFAILGVGSTPLQQRAVSTATLEPDGAPFGSRLSVAVPLIPTVAFEPDASFSSLSLSLGTVGNSPRAHAATGSILVPRRCPAGGFPFAVHIAFADGSTAQASASVRCP